MALSDDAAMMSDADLRSRLIACARREGIDNPEQWVIDNLGALAAQPGWSDSWASGVERRRYTVGNDPAVITDGNITAAVQALKPQA